MLIFFSSKTANQLIRFEGLSYPRPTKPNQLRYLLASLGSLVTIVGYALLQPSCRFLLIGPCDTSGSNFDTGLVTMCLGLILLAGVWINRIRFWSKQNYPEFNK
jgi:hypothetical protein